MIEKLKIVSLFLGVILSVLSLLKLILPIFRRRKLIRLFALIQDWFDEIDKNLETGINTVLLNNKEKKIDYFIADNCLKNYKIKITKTFVIKYLKKLGIKKELRNDMYLFNKYSRCSSKIIYLNNFWHELIGVFLKYYSAYKKGGNNYNYADIEMRINFLRLYLKIKEK